MARAITCPRIHSASADTHTNAMEFSNSDRSASLERQSEQPKGSMFSRFQHGFRAGTICGGIKQGKHFEMVCEMLAHGATRLLVASPKGRRPNSSCDCCSEGILLPYRLKQRREILVITWEYGVVHQGHVVEPKNGAEGCAPVSSRGHVLLRHSRLKLSCVVTRPCESDKIVGTWWPSPLFSLGKQERFCNSGATIARRTSCEWNAKRAVGNNERAIPKHSKCTSAQCGRPFPLQENEEEQIRAF